MAGTSSPVTPSVLEWALQEDGRDPRAVAEALDVDPDVLDAWLHGDARPTTGQVSELAKVLKRPRALFFMPRPPEAATLPTSFRHAPGEATRQVSAKARQHVRRARRVQQAVAWGLRGEPTVDVPRASEGSDPEAAALQARAWLGVTGSEQVAWRDDYEALRTWRTAFEDRGLLVFSLDIGRGDVRGFSAWDDRAPLVVANNTGVKAAARSFTLMHELGHLLLRQDAACIDIQAADDTWVSVERWCERFGAAVLMPAADINSWASALGLGTTDATLNDVSATMKRYRVSARAAALRLIYLGYAPESLYDLVVAHFTPRPQQQETKGYSQPRAVMRRRQYGDLALRTVLSTLPPRDALSVLRMEVADVRALAETLPGIREI